MKIVDLNVLLYVVNKDTPHHDRALRWWREAVNGDETIGLPWVVLLGFLRIATNATVFPRPLDWPAAADKIEEWLALDAVRLVGETDEHWRILRALLSTSGTAGNLTTDAHLAALAISHGATLTSFDSDFARFQGLRWENPSRQ